MCRLSQAVVAGARNVVPEQQREPGDRTPALLDERTQHFHVLVGQHRHLLGQGDFYQAFPGALEHIGIGLEFRGVGVAAGQRAALVSDVVRELCRGKAVGASAHGLLEQQGNLGRLGGAGGPVDGLVSHHVIAKRGQWREKGQIGSRTPAFRGIHELGEGLPIPGDPAVEHVKGHSLHIDEVVHRGIATCGVARRNPHAAVTEHDCRDAMPGRWRDIRIPADLRIVMGMRVNKTGGDDAIAGIDHALCVAGHLAHVRDLAVGYSNVRAPRNRAGSVNEKSALDYEIECHCFPQ